MLETRLLLGLGFATALVFWGTPVAIRVAARLNFYDRPAGYKGHGAPTPYLGGAPVVLAFVAVLAILTSDAHRTLPVAGGVIALWALGTLDDKRPVSPGLRVAAEALFATILYAAGDGWNLAGSDALGLVVTVVWVVGVVNALNLFDNMDGAASSIALVISAGVAVTGALQGDVWLAVAAAGLCGACLGFLPHNLAKPARIFLGDGGSMPLGFALAALVMLAAGGSGPAWQALAIGLLLVGVPALDTCLVIVSRRRRGISILTGGRDHLTHRTFQRLRTARAVAFALGAAQALLAILALLASRQSSWVLVVLVLLYLVGAATAITVLDRDTERAIPEDVAVPSDPATPPPPQPRPRVELALLVLLGLGAGLSPFFRGFYDQTVWVPIGLVLLALLTAVVIARPSRLPKAGIAAVAALGALGLVAIASSWWADAATPAVLNGNRYLVYAAFLALVLMLVRDRLGAALILGSFAAGGVAVAAVDLARMLGSDPGAAFVGGRLNDPLGYINGQADFFMLGAWICVACAAQVRVRWLAALALAAGTSLVSLAFLSQSRGVVLAGALSLVAVVALVPGRRRNITALAVLAVGVAVAAPALLDVFNSSAAGSQRIAAGAGHDAGRAIILVSLAAGCLWWVLLEIERAVRRRERSFDGIRIAFAAAGAVLLVAVLTVVAVNGGSIAHTVNTQYTAFVHLDPTQGGDTSAGRLASGGGNRYDYWRVAADTWRGHPLGGVGGGNYPQPYYLERRTTEAIQQPHSLELQTLSELGLVGTLPLLVLLGLLAVGLVAARRRAQGSAAERALLVACVGVLATWGVHTSVDWMHLLPGVTAAALIATAIMLRGTSPQAAAGARSLSRGRMIAAAVVIVAVALTATSLTRQALSDWFRSRGQDELAQRPAEALKWANRSLRLDADSVDTYYLKAAAIARFGAGPQAEQVLKTAIAREPSNFLSYALLGDLYTRERKIGAAKAAYRSALRRNPRDPALRQLAVDPTPETP